MNATTSLKLFVLLLAAAAIFPASAGRTQSNEASVQAAIGVLTDLKKGPEERINAARDLAVLGQDSNSAAEALMGALANDPNAGVRSVAAVAIGNAAFPSDAPIQALIRALASDTSADVRLAAVRGLSVIGVDSASALAALQSAAANDTDPRVKDLAQAIANRFSSN